MMNNPYTYLITALLLLGIGIFGFVRRRTLIGMLIAVELVLNGAGLNFVVIGHYFNPHPETGDIFTLIVMGVAAAEAVIALSIIIAIYRQHRSIDADKVSELKG